MRNWDTRDESGTDKGCEWEKDWEDVQLVCKKLGLPCELVSNFILFSSCAFLKYMGRSTCQGSTGIVSLHLHYGNGKQVLAQTQTCGAIGWCSSYWQKVILSPRMDREIKFGALLEKLTINKNPASQHNTWLATGGPSVSPGLERLLIHSRSLRFQGLVEFIDCRVLMASTATARKT